MKQLWKFLLMLLLAAPVWAGTTSLTGTVFDASNNPAVDGFVRFTIQPLLPNVVYRDAGTGIIIRTSSTCNIQSNGTILDTDNTTPCQMFDNDTITPANSFYKIELAPGGVVSDTFFAFITGATADLSTLLLATPSSAVPPPSFSVVLLPTISGDLNVTGDVTVDGDVSVGSQFIETIVGVASSATPTFDANLGSIFTNTLTANVTSSSITNAVLGQIITIYIVQDGTGGRTFAWPANVQLRASSYVVSPAISAVSVIQLYYDGTNWREISRAADATDETVFIQNNIIYADAQLGADLGVKITNCLARIPATGGICVARGLEGAQVISTTITVNKPVVILLGYTTITCSVSPCFDFVTAGAGSRLIGIGKGSSTTGGTRIVANDGTVTPLIRILGTAELTRISQIYLENLTIEGVFTVTQIGLSAHFATGIFLRGVQFTELGQAEDFDNVFLATHENVNYFHSGSGGTAATATVRIERRNGTLNTERIYWGLGCIWEGDNTGGNNKQGTAVWVGPNVQTVQIGEVGMDYNSTNADFPIVHFDKLNGGTIHDSVISATTITTASGVVEVDGDSGTASLNVHLINNRISTSATVSAAYFDWSDGGSLLGGTLTGLGSGTGITVTANAVATRVAPFRINSLTTILSDSSTSTQAMLPGATNVWQFPKGIAVGTGTHALTGLIRAANGVVVIRQRDAGDTADIAVIALDSNDDVQIGSTSADTRVVGKLGFGDIIPQSTGIIGPNNECYQSLDAGAAAVCIAVVDGSDILQIGDDSDLASIEIGAAAVPTAIGGALEYRDAPTLAASTTPSITGGNVFLTANTASITDFTGELNGQVIILLCGADTTTSLTDSSPLFLAGAFTCTTNDTISLVSNGTVWYETSRSVN